MQKRGKSPLTDWTPMLQRKGPCERKKMKIRYPTESHKLYTLSHIKRKVGWDIM